jgi:hypothetical protein
VCCFTGPNSDSASDSPRGIRREHGTHEEAGQTLAAERYLLDEMSNEQRESFEEHFFACDACAEDLRTAAAMLHGARAGFAGRTRPRNVVTMPVERPAIRRPAWQCSLALPWAAAAALACVVTYQSVWVVPSLRREVSPRALVPVTLHPESRGGEAVVARRSPADPVSLALEINDPPQAGEVTYELTTLEGRHVVSGQAATPLPGTPLLLLIPSWTLGGSMHYILSVHDAAASGRLLGEYRFAVSTQ